MSTRDTEKLRSIIKNPFETLQRMEPLGLKPSHQQKEVLEEALLAAIERCRSEKGYKDNAGTENQMYYLLQGYVGDSDFSNEIRKTRETLIELITLPTKPDVLKELEGYTRSYAGPLLKRLYFFFTHIQHDCFLTYLDKERIEGGHDYHPDALNRTLETYQRYESGNMYEWTQEGLLPSRER